MPNKTIINHSLSTTNISSVTLNYDTTEQNKNKKSIMSTSLVESSNKIRLPSFKKLKSKLSIRKSHSSAANLSDISKLKISSSSSSNTASSVQSSKQHDTNHLSVNYLNNNNHKQLYQHNHSFNENGFAVIHEDAISDCSTSVLPSSASSNGGGIFSGNGDLSKIKLRSNKKKPDAQKRISLPANMNYDVKQFYHQSQNDINETSSSISSPSYQSLIMKPLNRNSRRASMSELGYGKIESYKRLEKLGEGTYATVYKGESTINGSFVALKEIRLEHEEGAPCTAIREVSLLRQLKHANIVTLHDIIYTDKSLTLVFEYLEKDLKQYMDDCNNMMSIKNIKIFLFQLLRGLAYCHARQILHRDLKPQNLLINQKGELKLADFGLARAKSIPTKTYSNEVVTLWYRPPDVLLGSTDYSTHIDMWGVGCIFYEMVSGTALFPGTKVEDELYLIFKLLGTPTEQTFPGISTNNDYLALHLPKFTTCDTMSIIVPRLDVDGMDLLASFLKYNPKLRISAIDALIHKYFSTFPSSIHKLDNNQSIFDISTIILSKDPGIKLNNTAGSRLTNLYKL